MSWTRNPNDGTQLYYEAQGQGEPLVLIMGLGGSVAAWGMQWATFTREHRIIALDNRGAGQSDKPDTPYDTATMADDVLAVMDAEGVSQSAVLGVSMGGLIAQTLYHRAPERVTRLVLVATGPPVGSPDNEPPEPAVLAALERDRHTTDMRSLLEELSEVFYHPDYRRRIPNLVDWLVNFEQSYGQPAHAYHRQLTAILSDRTTPDRLESITVPTAIIHGRDDQVWPLRNAERMAARLPYGELRIVEGAGHMVMMEQPRVFNSTVLEFTATKRG